MKNIFFVVTFALACNLSFADESPVVGLWEQMAVSGEHSSGQVVRPNIIFTNQRIDGHMTFSALADAGSKAQVICCLRVDNKNPITIFALLNKYKWDEDSANHLRSIKGWSYIYEAELVRPSLQNARMREIIVDMGSPGDISPFSAAVVSAEFDGKVFIDKRFSVGKKEVIFSINADQSKEIMQYQFSVGRRKIVFVEEMFPD